MLPAGIGAEVPMMSGSFTVPVHASPGCAVSEVIAVFIVTAMPVPAGTSTPLGAAAGAGVEVLFGFGLFTGFDAGFTTGSAGCSGGAWSNDSWGVRSPGVCSVGFIASRLSALVLSVDAWSVLLPQPASMTASAMTLAE